MQVEFLLNWKDLFRMLRHIHTGQYPRRNYFFYALSVFCLLYVFYNLANSTGDVRFLYGIILLPLFYMIIIPLALLFKAKNMWKREELFQKKFQYKFDSKGIHMNSAGGKGLVEWETLRKVHGTREDFIFYVARTQAFIIPLSSMNDEKQEKLREILKENLSEDKLKL